jgi:RimJ/RimL family protein N-acetyltransferase
MIETERLILRRWRGEDREPFAAMMADPQVGYWLAGTFTRAESDAYIDRVEAHFNLHGFGRFALERKVDGVFIGSCGLAVVHEVYRDTPVAGGVEIGWRLAREAWGSGYATEAAAVVVEDGFTSFGLREILAFTTKGNLRSRAVMERLGMARDAARDFDHPALAQDDPLCAHLVHVARR